MRFFQAFHLKLCYEHLRRNPKIVLSKSPIHIKKKKIARSIGFIYGFFDFSSLICYFYFGMLGYFPPIERISGFLCAFNNSRG